MSLSITFEEKVLINLYAVRLGRCLDGSSPRGSHAWYGVCVYIYRTTWVAISAAPSGRSTCCMDKQRFPQATVIFHGWTVTSAREQCFYREALFLAQSMGQATCASAGRVMYTIGQALTYAELSFTHTRKGANMPVSPLIRVESGYLLSNGRWEAALQIKSNRVPLKV